MLTLWSEVNQALYVGSKNKDAAHGTCIDRTGAYALIGHPGGRNWRLYRPVTGDKSGYLPAVLHSRI